MTVLFCTPCYGGMIHEAHFRSCLALKDVLIGTGLGHDWLTGRNESLVTRARNEMTASFLATDHSHMMWLDADIEFEPEDVAKLWNLDADIAVGCYAMKKRDQQWFAAWFNGELIKDIDQFKQPIDVDFAGTGFMLIKRGVIEALVAQSPSYEGPNGRVPALYMTPVHNDGFESEDFHFCRIARDAGYRIVMDPSVRLKHWGQYAYGA